MGLTNGRFRISLQPHQREEPTTQPPRSLALDDYGTQPPASTSSIQAPSANEETTELLKTTHHIRTQLHETQRQRQLKGHVLNTAERDWADATIEDIAGAVREVSALLEPTRVEQEVRKSKGGGGSGRLGLGRHLRWAWRDGRRARDRSRRLLACHQSLMNVLGYLQRLEPVRAGAAVHELGGDLPSLCSSSQSERQRAGSVSTSHGPGPGSGPVGEEAMATVPESLGYDEMYDMLSWRQSKGASVQMNRAPDIA